jgi:proteasome lid subunit RPN8/RPN11
LRQVIVKFKAFREMVNFFSQHSSNKHPEEQWVESMGFLFCSIEGDYYIVEDAIGMTSGTELDVQLSPQSLANIEQMERDHEGFIGGWWHTHPGLSPFFSETDIKNQVFYQTANPDGLGIVFDHSMIDKNFIGFQIFRLLHQFSEKVIEVPYQLLGFTKEGIKETLEVLGIDNDIIEALMEKYGGEGVALKIDFSKLGEPIVSDPLDDSEWIVMEAEESLKEDKIIDAIKKYKTAAMILEKTEYVEKFAEMLCTLIKLCAENNYIENAKEELQNLKILQGKLSTDKYKTLYYELKDLIDKE